MSPPALVLSAHCHKQSTLRGIQLSFHYQEPHRMFQRDQLEGKTHQLIQEGHHLLKTEHRLGIRWAGWTETACHSHTLSGQASGKCHFKAMGCQWGDHVMRAPQPFLESQLSLCLPRFLAVTDRNHGFSPGEAHMNTTSNSALTSRNSEAPRDHNSMGDTPC